MKHYPPKIKPMEYIVELTPKEAVGFLEDWFNPKPNPARDATIKRVKAMKFNVKY